MQAIKDNIYFEGSYAGVTLGAIILPQGTIMIDTPLRSEDARAWKSFLINQGWGTHRVMINLDEHHDRTIGARALDCVVLAHKETALSFQDRPAVFKGHDPESSAEWGSHLEVVGSRWAHPNITFSDEIRIHWGDPEVLIQHHPGPTPGAIWVDIPSEKIVFVGDAVTLNQPPFLAQADLQIWIETLDILVSRKYRDYIIISGRGGPTDISGVRAQRRRLKKILNRLEKLAQRDALPEATERIIPSLLSDITYPPEYHDFYSQRLRYGLFHYYIRHYRPIPMNEF